MKFAKTVAVLVLSLVIAGCNSGPEDNPVDVVPPSAVESLRTGLTQLAETGQSIGSGAQTFQQYIEEIKKTDSAKAAKLQEGLDALMPLQDSAKIKAKAKEMISNL